MRSKHLSLRKLSLNIRAKLSAPFSREEKNNLDTDKRVTFRRIFAFVSAHAKEVTREDDREIILRSARKIVRAHRNRIESLRNIETAVTRRKHISPRALLFFLSWVRLTLKMREIGFDLASEACMICDRELLPTRCLVSHHRFASPLRGEAAAPWIFKTRLPIILAAADN